MSGELRDARILVTAFEPWGEHRVNTSQVAVEGLDGQVIDGALVRVRHVPVEWDEAPRQLFEEIADWEPAAVVGFGMQKGPEWRVELLARNRDHRSEGEETETVIDVDAPRILPTGLPAAGILAKLLDAGLEAKPSEDAGAFLCNHLFFWMMKAVEEGAGPTISGFVHVPGPVFAEGSDRTGEPRNAPMLQEGARLVLEAVSASVARRRP